MATRAHASPLQDGVYDVLWIAYRAWTHELAAAPVEPPRLGKVEQAKKGLFGEDLWPDVGECRFKTGFVPLKTGFGRFKTGFDRFKTGFDGFKTGFPLENGIWPLQNEIWPLQNGICPSRNGIWPVQTGFPL